MPSTMNYIPPIASSAAGSGQDNRGLLRSWAASYLPANFADWFYDFVHTHEGVVSAGIVGGTFNGVTTGRSGGGRIGIDMTGAGGIADFHAGIPFSQGVPLPLVADAGYDPFFVAWGGIISAVSAAGELGLCGLSHLGDVRATDGVSQPYIYLGAVGSVSTTLLTIATWDATTKRTLATTVAMDIAANAYHIIALASRGLGLVDVIVDGVVAQAGINLGSIAPLPTGVNGQFFMRTTTAAHNTIVTDFGYAAGARI